MAMTIPKLLEDSNNQLYPDWMNRILNYQELLKSLIETYKTEQKEKQKENK